MARSYDNMDRGRAMPAKTSGEDPAIPAIREKIITSRPKLGLTAPGFTGLPLDRRETIVAREGPITTPLKMIKKRVFRRHRPRRQISENPYRRAERGVAMRVKEGLEGLG